jgi:hypothetical protein
MEKIKDGLNQYLTPILMAVVAFFLREVYTKVDNIATEIRTLSEDRAVMTQKIISIERNIYDLEARLREIEKEKK